MKVVLVDGKNFAYRHAWTHRGLSSQGQGTSLIYGGVAGLLTLAKQFPNTPIVFVWDSKATTWRHEYAPIYKANRGTLKEMPSDVKVMHKQIPLFKKFLDYIGIRQFMIKGLEADDLIGMLATEIVERKMFDEVIIHSSDKDFYQLLAPRIRILRSVQKKNRFMAPKDVEVEFGVPAAKWAQYRALIGDPSDNIPHPVKGLGPKGAAKLIQAGCNPAYDQFEMHDKKTRKELVKVKDQWSDIHRNFVLSLIVCYPHNIRLSEEVRASTKKMFSKLKKSRFRRPKDHAPENFHLMSKWMAKYELNSLFNRRREIWHLAV